jgi:hypothetical protein
MFLFSLAVGRTAPGLPESRFAGWANYAPLWGCWGGGGRTPPCNRKKRKHGRLRFFLPLGPRLRPGEVSHGQQLKAKPGKTHDILKQGGNIMGKKLCRSGATFDTPRKL